MLLSKRKFITGLAGLVAAPAVVQADSLMKVHTIPERYATVWGVGWDLEVVEHVVWTRQDALQFARFGTANGIAKFREVTEVVYTAPQPAWPILRSNHWTQRDWPADPMDRFAKMQTGVVETTFDDPKELEGKHSYVRKLDLEQHCSKRHAEHMAELERNKKNWVG